MGLIAFDTIEYSRKLQDAGMPQPQADAIARAQREMFADVLEQKELATKVDIVLLQKDNIELKSELKQDIADLRQEVADLRTELKQDIANVRQEVADLRTELKQDIANVRTELKGEMAGLRDGMTEMESRIMKAMYNALFGFAAVIVAVAAVTAAWLKN